MPDARDIVEELTAKGIRLNMGGSVHDPTDPVGRLLFTTLSMIAEFESDLIKMRTREGIHNRRRYSDRCGRSTPAQMERLLRRGLPGYRATQWYEAVVRTCSGWEGGATGGTERP